MRRSIALLVAGAAVAGCAPTDGTASSSQIGAPTSGARQCFEPDRIVNFTRGETEQVYVKVFGGGVFSIRSGGCPDVGRANSLSITPATGVGSQLCVGDTARIVAPNTGFGPDQCLARVERSLTQAEVDALPSAQRP